MIWCLKNFKFRTIEHFQLASKRKKSVHIEWMIFNPYLNMGGKEQRKYWTKKIVGINNKRDFLGHKPKPALRKPQHKFVNL